MITDDTHASPCSQPMKNPASPSCAAGSGDSYLISAVVAPSSTEVINGAGEFYPNAGFILINNNFVSVFY